jgi:hypothetical protein
MKIDVKKLALTGGIYLSGMTALVTMASLLGIPGFPQFTKMLVDVYGPWGYSISLPGVLIGAVWGFVEGFIHFGIFGWIYNKIKS